MIKIIIKSLILTSCVSVYAYANLIDGKNTSVITSITVKHNDSSHAKTTSGKFHKYKNSQSDTYINFMQEDSKPKQDVSFAVFPEFNEKEYIAQQNKAMMNGNMSQADNFLVTLFRLDF